MHVEDPRIVSVMLTLYKNLNFRERERERELARSVTLCGQFLNCLS
jgi:hypothetical protein